MKPLLVIDVVGLTPSLLGENTPNINRIASDGYRADLEGVFPAVTCTAQSSMLTGTLPREHGIVANGWHFRELEETWLWRQSNRLVAGEKVWEAARRRDPEATCAKLFWWYNMYSSADVAVTPRPVYPADGRKLPDIYTWPYDLRGELNEKLGEFPLFHFWGPKADIRSSEWIAQSALHVMDRRPQTLTLVYLPHLDYPLQKYGPDDPRIGPEAAGVDRLVGKLAEKAREKGMEVVVLSEYGIGPVTDAVHINRVLREAGYLNVIERLGLEYHDFGASRAFAVADHQVAHVYVRDSSDLANVKGLLEKQKGIDRVLDEAGKREMGIDHPRCGDLVALSAPDRWFSYYYWLDDAKAPDYARTVDIHRKPGYDPVELFVDPELFFPMGRVAFRLLQKKLGMRYLMDVIPLRTELVRGSHGLLPTDPQKGPVWISSSKKGETDRLKMTDVKSKLLEMMFQE